MAETETGHECFPHGHPVILLADHNSAITLGVDSETILEHDNPPPPADRARTDGCTRLAGRVLLNNSASPGWGGGANPPPPLDPDSIVGKK